LFHLKANEGRLQVAVIGLQKGNLREGYIFVLASRQKGARCGRGWGVKRVLATRSGGKKAKIAHRDRGKWVHLKNQRKKHGRPKKWVCKKTTKEKLIIDRRSSRVRYEKEEPFPKEDGIRNDAEKSSGALEQKKSEGTRSTCYDLVRKHRGRKKSCPVVSQSESHADLYWDRAGGERKERGDGDN